MIQVGSTHNFLLEEFCDSVSAVFCDPFFENRIIGLNEPILGQSEKDCINACIESGFVSTVGAEVAQFEDKLRRHLHSDYVIAVNSGTSALHLALLASGVRPEDEVLTTPLTFIATANAIKYCGAHPVFLDIELGSMGMCPEGLRQWLDENAKVIEGKLVNKTTGRRLAGVLPVHVLGNVCLIRELSRVCQDFELPLIEDAAEALGSSVEGRSAGSFGDVAAVSFNGNKILTTGAGGAVLTDNREIAERVRHIANVAKVDHAWRLDHDQLGYNYRMPALNASLGLAQLDRLNDILDAKQKLFRRYEYALSGCCGVRLVRPTQGTQSNHWVIAAEIETSNLGAVVETLRKKGLFARPLWTLLFHAPHLSMYQISNCYNAKSVGSKVICLPSTVSLEMIDE